MSVYRIVSEDSIDEAIMAIQAKKLALSRSIVNSDNSSLLQMGTERLLDIFQVRNSPERQSSKNNELAVDLDALLETYREDYSSLSIGEFIKALS